MVTSVVLYMSFIEAKLLYMLTVYNTGVQFLDYVILIVNNNYLSK